MYKLKNKEGAIKEAPIGFSWTVLFFGFFVPFFRKDWKWGFIMMGISFLLNFILFIIAPFVVQIVFAVIYNDIYLKELQDEGYVIIK